MTQPTLDNSPDTVLDNVQDSLDITEAAARLGVSTETVRKRLQRGKIKGFKAPDGSWRVVLPSQDSPGQQPGQGPDIVQDKPGQPNQELVTALREEVAFLRTQLQARDEEIRRAHILLQTAQQQATALLPVPLEDASQAVLRGPWWRRLFGR